MDIFIWIMLPFSLGIFFTFKFFAAVVNKEQGYMRWGVYSAICLGFGISMVVGGLT